MSRYILGAAWRTICAHCVDVRDDHGHLVAVVSAKSAEEALHRAELIIAAFNAAEKEDI